MFLGTCPKRTETMSTQNSHTMITTGLFTVATTWKQQDPLVGEVINWGIDIFKQQNSRQSTIITEH